MGCWGPGTLENDEALDWLDSLDASVSWQDLALVVGAAEQNCSSVELAMRAVAACEVVAARLAQESTALPPGAQTWLKQTGEMPEELALIAQNCITAISADSDLKVQWSDSCELKQWKQDMAGLLKRLKRKARAARDEPGKTIAVDAAMLATRLTKQIATKNWEQAIKTCSILLSIDETRVATRNNLAWCLTQIEQLDAAEVEIEKTLAFAKQQPNLLPATFAACIGTRAHINLKKGNLDAALTGFNEALAIVPRAINFKARAEVFSAMGNDALAEKDRAEYNRLSISDAFKRATKFWNDILYRECLAELNAILELAPENKLALLRRGLLNFELKHFQAADADFSKWLELFGDDPNVLFERAQLRSQLGMTDLARVDRERCHELGFDTVAFYDKRVAELETQFARISQKPVDKALLRELELIVTLVPEHVRARNLLVRCFVLNEQEIKVKRLRDMENHFFPLAQVQSKNLERAWSKWFWGAMTEGDFFK